MTPEFINFIFSFTYFIYVIKYGYKQAILTNIIRCVVVYGFVMLIISMLYKNLIIYTALAGFFIMFYGITYTIALTPDYINFHMQPKYNVVIGLTIASFAWGQMINGVNDNEITIHETLFVGLSINGILVYLLFFMRFGYFGNLIEDIFQKKDDKRLEQEEEINESLMVDL